MELKTKHFGTLTVEESQIIRFPDGIPGFADQTRYVFIQNPEDNLPFHWLQSLEDGELTFVVMNPFLCRPDYDFQLAEHVVKKLDIKKQEDVRILCIVKVPEKVEDMTINLLAPLIINDSANQAAQVVLDENRYHTRHRLADEFARMNEINQNCPEHGETDGSPGENAEAQDQNTNSSEEGDE